MEQEIIALLRRREEAGIELLVRHYGALMRYIVTPILSREQDREECLSEITAKIWEKIDQFDLQKGSWSAWLTAVSRNTALNHARRQAAHDDVEELTEAVPSTQPTPEEQVMRQELQAALATALMQLSFQDRTLFYRKYYYLQPTAQIAAELGMTERAVEGKLYRIKKRLRDRLGGVIHD